MTCQYNTLCSNEVRVVSENCASVNHDRLGGKQTMCTQEPASLLAKTNRNVPKYGVPTQHSVVIVKSAVVNETNRKSAANT
jgi:hypothetical protein